MKLKSARIGSTLYVFDTASEAKVRENILPDGEAIVFTDKSSEWIVDEPVVDTSKSGSAQYTWDKTGNRVRHARCQYNRDAAGNVTRKVLKHVYREL